MENLRSDSYIDLSSQKTSQGFSDPPIFLPSSINTLRKKTQNVNSFGKSYCKDSLVGSFFVIYPDSPALKRFTPITRIKEKNGLAQL